MNFRFYFAVLVLCLILPVAPVSFAAYPEKPLTVIVPFEAGAGVDTIVRVAAKYAPKYLGQDWVIVNKPGAGGQTGWNALLREPADGYTIAATVIPNIVIQPMLRDSGTSGYKFEDLEHLATVCVIPDVLLVSKDSPHKTLEDFLKAAGQKANAVTVGIPAVRSGPHVLTLMLEREKKLSFNIIPESGGATLLKGIMGGHIDAMMANLAVAVQNEANVRILAVAAEERDSIAPNAPTFKEQGLDFVEQLTRGFAAPKGTPEAILKHLRDGFAQMAKDPAFIADLKQIRAGAHYLDAEATRKMGEDIARQTWIMEAFKKQ